MVGTSSQSRGIFFFGFFIPLRKNAPKKTRKNQWHGRNTKREHNCFTRSQLFIPVTPTTSTEPPLQFPIFRTPTPQSQRRRGAEPSMRPCLPAPQPPLPAPLPSSNRAARHQDLRSKGTAAVVPLVFRPQATGFLSGRPSARCDLR
jgi:hypothetical protein